jgi:PAS domain S-box-containing protein
LSLAAIWLSVRDADEHGIAAALMAIGTAGWFGAGIMVVVLVGRASIDHHHQWVEARKARDLLRETLEVLPAGVVVFDPDERLVIFNKAAASVTPALQADQVGKTYEEIGRVVARTVEEAGGGPQPWQQWLDHFRAKDRRRIQRAYDGRWIEWNEKATPAGYTVGLRVDVTDLKTSQLELERARGEYQSLVNSLTDMVYVLDSKGVFVFVSAASEKVLGMEPSRLLGVGFGALVVPDDLDRATAAARTHLKSTDQGVREINLRLKRADGSIRHMECRWRSPPDGLRPDAAAVGVMRDVTERREAETALHEAERFATVGEMAATMAHDISQPLQVINIACESARDALAEDHLDAAFQKAKLDRIAQQVETASRMVSDLRAFVRGAGPPEGLGPFDAREAIKSAVDITAHSLRQAGITLRFHGADRLPPVRGHSGRLEQVLVNLINNARDAGGRTIDISAQAVERDGLHALLIAVEDSGPGIPAEVMPRRFVSFVTTKAKGKGTGLGLRICRRIVAEMGGTISAANRAEGGARFEMLLPVA